MRCSWTASLATKGNLSPTFKDRSGIVDQKFLAHDVFNTWLSTTLILITSEPQANEERSSLFNIDTRFRMGCNLAQFFQPKKRFWVWKHEFTNWCGYYNVSLAIVGAVFFGVCVIACCYLFEAPVWVLILTHLPKSARWQLFWLTPFTHCMKPDQPHM